MKGQAQLMEYIFMTLLIVVILFAVIIFLAGWQATQLKLEKTKTQSQYVLNLLKLVSTSPLFVKEPSVYDAGKLLALKQECKELEKLFGRFTLNVTLVGQELTECTSDTWPDCTSWLICPHPGNYTAYGFPAAIYWPAGRVTDYGIHPRIDLGWIEVRWYE